MLRSLKEIIGYSIQETDDVLGTCQDFIFDDALWVIRYMVADTGNWLRHHRVIIPPAALGEPDWNTERLPIRYTREQLENCPLLDQHAPVSRQYEMHLHDYLEIPFYWISENFLEGIPDGKGVVRPVDEIDVESSGEEESAAANVLEGKLRSAIEIMSYDASSVDGDIGRVDDMIIEDNSWVIRYMVIDTGAILPGKKVLVDTQWIEEVRWDKQRVIIDMTRETLEGCPEYDPDAAVNREYEVRLYDYHGKPKYWE